MDRNTYTMMVWNKSVFNLPNLRKARIDVLNNWIYQTGAPSPNNTFKDESEPNNSNHPLGTAMKEDVVPRPTRPTQSEIQGIKTKQNRQSMVLDDIQAMM